jgi:hypothetical protein
MQSDGMRRSIPITDGVKLAVINALCTPLSLSVRGILQGLRSDGRQRVEAAMEHDCVNFAGVADVFERIHVEQHQIRHVAHLNRSISISFAQELCRV